MEEEQSQAKREKKGLIKIPSYQEVFGGGGDSSSSAASRPYNPPPPPPSFSQAFSFIKTSEFYTPPPPSPAQGPRPNTVSASVLPSTLPSSSSSPATAGASGGASPSPAQNRNAILVGHRQKGNPLLKYLVFEQKGIHKEDVVKPLLEVTRTSMLHDCTLLCGWSLEECGRYLETVKVYENKSADSIREQMDTDYLSRLTHALTSVRRVNKTDVVTLGSTFGVKRLYDTFHEPLRRVSTRPDTVPNATPVEGKNVQPRPTTSSKKGEEAKTPSESGKETTPSVRSALTAAFSKYAERVGKHGR